MKTDFTRQMVIILTIYAALLIGALARYGSGITHAIFNF